LQSLDNPSQCIAISVPNSGYLLGLNLPFTRIWRLGLKIRGGLNSRGVNIFKKYKIKTLVLWDDPFGQFTQSILNIDPDNITTEKCGVIRTLRNYFDDWDCQHLAWDSGHLAWIKSLNFLPERSLHFSPLPAHSAFLRPDQKRNTVRDLAFFGNIYLNKIYNDNFYKNELIQKILYETKNNIHIVSSFENIKLIKKECLKFLKGTSNNLEDNSAFWPIYRNLIWYYINTEKRTQVLTNIKKKVNFFGNFADPKSGSLLNENIIFNGNLDFFKELPSAFEETKITIDVTNSLSINGVTGKFYECFASNGFMLIDYKSDLQELLGNSNGKKIMYKSLNELKDKIAYYLSHPKEREELRQNIKNIVIKNCSPQKWCSTIKSIYGY
jgi:hypothetical protein